MKGLFLTRKTALNLFWIVVGASGTGKSMSRKHFISDPLEYIMNNKKVDVKASRFPSLQELVSILCEIHY